MSYRSKREAMDAIRTRTLSQNGKSHTIYEVYLGRDPLTGRPVRVARHDRKALESYISDFCQRISRGGETAVMLTPYQTIDAKSAYDLLALNGKATMSLQECVKTMLALEEKKPETRSETLGNAFRAYAATFGEGLHRKAVLCRVGRFVQHVGGERQVSEVTAGMAAEFLKTLGTNAKTYNNFLSYIKTFMNWCTKKERRYIADNPLSDMSLLHIAYKEPEYVKPEAAAKLFAYLDERKGEMPEVLAYCILSFLCGVRREEIMRMAELDDAAKIDLEDETVRISKPKGWTKGVSPRAFHIMPCALAWMKSFDFLTAIKKVNGHTTNRVAEAFKAVNEKYPKNAGRHTFITMHVAAFGDPSKTEAMVGTSKKMRVSNYCGLASKKEGEAYFAISPSAN